jgi:hypothetical protein
MREAYADMAVATVRCDDVELSCLAGAAGGGAGGKRKRAVGLLPLSGSGGTYTSRHPRRCRRRLRRARQAERTQRQPLLAAAGSSSTSGNRTAAFTVTVQHGRIVAQNVKPLALVF